MTDPLATLFQEVLRERIYLHNVTPRTHEWHKTAWKAFLAEPFTPESGDPAGDGGTLTKARLRASVVQQREPSLASGLARSTPQALNAFARWLHEERRHSLVRLPRLRACDSSTAIVLSTSRQWQRTVESRR